MKDFGLIHIYCGDGKGKTTASMGLALRASAFGARVMVVQFLKSGYSPEVVALKEKMGVTVLAYPDVKGFSKFFDEDQRAACRKVHDENLKTAIAKAGEFDLLVLDEIIGSLDTGLVDGDLLLDFLKTKPCELEVVLSGRNPSQALCDLADYVSEIKKIKHPYDKGVAARAGIEK